MKKVLRSVAIAAGLTIGASVVHADMHPGVQGLNDLLIQKGIITKEEVEAQAKKHSLNITGYIQVQGMIIENNDEMTYETTPKAFADEDGFKIRRAKIAASGYAYEHVKFKLEADLTRSTSAILDDAFIEDDHLPYLIGRLGQFKVPFSLEMLTSDTEILTIERSEAANQIAPERDMGISFSGSIAEGLVNYSIGAFNGHAQASPKTYSVGSFSNAGRNATNDNDQLMAAGRLVIKPVEWISIGAAGLTSKDGTGTSTTEHKAFEAELQVKNPKRGCSLQGEYMRQWLKDTGDATTTSDGFYLQAGHFVVEKHLEAVVKYEEYDSDKDVADRDDIKWTTVGLNFYIFGNHDAKLMANYVVKDEKQDGYKNNTFLTQLQLRF